MIENIPLQPILSPVKAACPTCGSRDWHYHSLEVRAVIAGGLVIGVELYFMLDCGGKDCPYLSDPICTLNFKGELMTGLRMREKNYEYLKSLNLFEQINQINLKMQKERDGR